MGDGYLRNILTKYAVNAEGAMAAGNAIYPVLDRWGNGYIVNAEFSGSLAKGTCIALGTDADIFLSLAANTPGTLAQIYNTLYSAVTRAGYSPRKQNVSIGVTVNNYSIDLVPGRRRAGNTNDHSLYRSKASSWTQTNVVAHIDYVLKSGRHEEIKILKIWRQLHKVTFPSFYLEMAVIQGLGSARHGNLAANVWKTFEHLRDRIEIARYVDPANSNNVISDDCTSSEKRSIAEHARRSLEKQHWEEIVW